MPETKKDWIYFILGGFFIANAIMAELTGSILFSLGTLDLGFIRQEIILPVGLIPWPVVFIITDLVNEYFGVKGVRKITFLAIGLILYCFLIIFIASSIPSWEGSPISSAMFQKVMQQSLWLITGSVIAFGISQLVDVLVFVAFKKKTQGRMLWLRATGSTIVSQLIDTMLVQYIGFVLPGALSFSAFISVSINSYLYKLFIAIAITPLIYLAHAVIDRYLSKTENG